MIRFAENLNKMIAAGLGGAMEAPSTEVAVGHRVVYTEVSGALVNFETNVIAPVKNLRVTMKPIQDLHGQDAPYPAGGGKNLVDWVGPQTLTSQTTFAEYATSEQTQFTASITAAKNNEINGQLNIYAYNGNTLAKSVRGIISSTTAERVSATIDLADTVYTSLRIVLTGVSAGYSATCSDLQLERGSEATSYAPYENICPITGRDAVTVYHSGEDATYYDSITVQLGRTVYGGTLDVSTGKLTVTHGEIASYNGEVLTGEWISNRDVYAAGTTPTIGAQVVYVLDTPQTIDLDPQQITTLIGDNNVWSDAGDVSLEYPYYEETEGY